MRVLKHNLWNPYQWASLHPLRVANCGDPAPTSWSKLTNSHSRSLHTASYNIIFKQTGEIFPLITLRLKCVQYWLVQMARRLFDFMNKYVNALLIALQCFEIVRALLRTIAKNSHTHQLCSVVAFSQPPLLSGALSLNPSGSPLDLTLPPLLKVQQIVTLLFCIAVICIFSGYLSYKEKWSYFDSVYFTFISFTTIGFGGM